MNIIYIPKIRKDKLDVDNKYQLIVQNNYNQRIYVYDVEDITPDNKVRFKFDINELPAGNYHYLLVSNEDWEVGDIDQYDMKESLSIIDNDAPAFNDSMLIIGGKLLVMGKFKTPVFKDDGYCTSTYELKSVEASNESVTGDIVNKCMDIIVSGMFDVRGACDEVTEYNSKRKIIQYEG